MNAVDMDAACEIATGCPILEGGSGTVEVAEAMEMTPPCAFFFGLNTQIPSAPNHPGAKTYTIGCARRRVGFYPTFTPFMQMPPPVAHAPHLSRDSS